jgi:4-amino-4-deoxy-L-arabinose transferase-like glycosyltransferase
MVGEESSYRFTEFIRDNHFKILTGIVFVIGIVLRLLFINTREIAYDDAFSYFLARQPFPVIVSGTAADTMPPLYYFLLHCWIWISEELWFLRLLNVIFNMSSAIIVYFITKDLFNKKAALIALFLFVISPFQVYHSQELRMYSLLLFGQIGFIYSVMKISLLTTKHQKLWMVLAVLFGCIAMYSHNLGVIGIISVNILFIFEKVRKQFKKILIIQFFILIFSLPWFYYLPQQIEKVQQAFWTNPPGLAEVLQAFLTLFAFLPMPKLSMAIVLIMLLSIIVVLTIYLFRSESKTARMLILFILFPPVLLFLLSYIVQPVFVPRIFISSAAWAFILCGKYLEEGIKFPVGKLNFMFLVIISVLSLPHLYLFESFPRSDFRGLSSHLKSLEDNGALIVHDNKLSFFPTMFYGELNNQNFIRDVPGSPNDTLAKDSELALGFESVTGIEEFLDEEEIVFVVFQRAIDEFSDQGMNHPVLAELQKNFSEDYSINSVSDLNIYHFHK